MANLCHVDGCERVVKARQLCSPHYMQMRRYGHFNKPLALIHCVGCGSPLETHRSNARYCSPRCQRRAWALSKYDISVDQYLAMLRAQEFSCAICQCGIDFCEAHVDHDHNTGVVRGLLCKLCNVGLGYFRDDPELLVSASGYLR